MFKHGRTYKMHVSQFEILRCCGRYEIPCHNASTSKNTILSGNVQNVICRYKMECTNMHDFDN